jgi:uncharacterized protein YndB with AHSA1/START domain
MTKPSLRLVVRRTIPARPERLFEAWTQPEQLRAWWGPRGVRCTGAEVDARVGGRYKIQNELPDGRTLVISGTFVSVEPPERLVYTWAIEGSGEGLETELVTVQFQAHPLGAEVIVTHERIADDRARDQHASGWQGCLDGLASHV